MNNISKLVVLLGLLLVSSLAFAQIEEDWSQTYGHQVSLSEIDSENNLVVFYSDIDGNLIFIKYNPQGDTLWDISLNIIDNYSGGKIVLDQQNNIYVIGTMVDVNQNDVNTGFVIKLNSSGVFQWSRILDLSSINIPDVHNMGVVRDAGIDTSGNIYVLGEIDYYTNVAQNWTRTAWYIYTYNSDGNFAWEYIHQGSVDESRAYTYDFDVSPDGTIYAVGSINILNSPRTEEFAVIKVSSSGVLQWERTFEDDNRGTGVYVAANNDGTVLTRLSGRSNRFLRCYNATGTFLWSKTYNQNTEFDGVSSIVVDTDDNFYVSLRKTAANNFFAAIMKYRATDGSPLRKRIINHNASSVKSTEISADGNLVITGTTYDGSEGSIFTAMYDEQGYEQWSHIYSSEYSDNVWNLNVGDSGVTYILGAYYLPGVGYQGQLIKYTIKKTIIPWKNDLGGLFSVNTNWLGDEVPNDFETALYDSANYEFAKSPEVELNVTFDQVTSNGGLMVENSKVNFDLQEHSYGVDKIMVGAEVPSI